MAFAGLRLAEIVALPFPPLAAHGGKHLPFRHALDAFEPRARRSRRRSVFEAPTIVRLAGSVASRRTKDWSI